MTHPSSIDDLDKPKSNDEKFVAEAEAMSGAQLGRLLRGPKGHQYRQAIDAAYARLAKKNPKLGQTVHRVTFSLNSANDDTKD